MVIENCPGCDEDLWMAYKLQKKGYHFATAIGRDFIIGEHIHIVMVNNDGVIMND